MSDITHVTSGDDEMANMAQRFFTKASDAIVQASRLAKVVEDLQAQVASLTARIDSVVAENEQLRNELGQVRSERDDYRNRLGQSEAEHNQTKAEFERHKTESAQAYAGFVAGAEARYTELQGRFDKLDENHTTALNALAEARLNYSNSVQRANELQAKLNEAEVKLEAIYNIVGKPIDKVTDEPVRSLTMADMEGQPTTDPSSVSSDSSSSTEQPRNENGLFEPVPMAARDFQY